MSEVRQTLMRDYSSDGSNLYTLFFGTSYEDLAINIKALLNGSQSYKLKVVKIKQQEVAVGSVKFRIPSLVVDFNHFLR